MKIGQLAAATATQTDTIRFYEREGLLPPPARSEGNFRLYDRAHVQRLAFIRHCRCLDMTLDEIRVLLKYKDAPQESCGAVNRLLDEHIGHVVVRIRELQALEKELKTLREACMADGTAAECGVLDGIERGAREHDHGSRAPGDAQHLAGVHAVRARPNPRTPEPGQVANR